MNFQEERDFKSGPEIVENIITVCEYGNVLIRIFKVSPSLSVTTPTFHKPHNNRKTDRFIPNGRHNRTSHNGGGCCATTTPSFILQESAHISDDVFLSQRGIRSGTRLRGEEGRIVAHRRPKDLLHSQSPETGGYNVMQEMRAV